jgi:xanthine/uracil permease
VLAGAIFVVGLLLIAERMYVTLSGDYLDSGAKGPAWGFLQALWIGLIVLLVVLVMTYFIRLLWRRSRSSAAS